MVELFSIGKKASSHFKTIPPDDVKEVYKIIIDELLNPRWSRAKIDRRLQAQFPQLKWYEVRRISQTEIRRIVNHAREFALDDDTMVHWTGPTDERTTDICMEIKRRTKGGVKFSELKRIIQDVVRQKGGHMIDSLTPHINCRHTHMRMPKRPVTTTPEIIDETILGLPRDFSQVSPSMQGILHVGEQSAEAPLFPKEPSEFQPPQPFADPSYRIGFNTPLTRTTYIGEAPLFVFYNLEPYEVGSVSRLLVTLENTGMTPTQKVMMMVDMYPKLSRDEIAFIAQHYRSLYQDALLRGLIDT